MTIALIQKGEVIATLPLDINGNVEFEGEIPSIRDISRRGFQFVISV